MDKKEFEFAFIRAGNIREFIRLFGWFPEFGEVWRKEFD